MSLATQQLKVKVHWLKNVLGLSVDHIVAKQAYPLTQHYFWPRTEAWDQLKLELDSKPWLSEKEKIISFYRSNLALYSDKISQCYLNLINDQIFI